MEMPLELPTLTPVRRKQPSLLLSTLPTIVLTFLGLVVSVILKATPYMVLRIPKYGYIVWALIVGTMPPFYDSGCYMHGNSKKWLRNDDVIVSAAAKSGATWILYCSHQIRTKGDNDFDNFIDPNYNTPWPEFIQNPGENWKTQWNKYSTTILPDGKPLKEYWDHPTYPFRIFKSHNPPTIFQEDRLIQEANKANTKKNGKDATDMTIKFVAMVRNGLDQAESMIPFFDLQHQDSFRKRWGGYPPKSNEQQQMNANTKTLQNLMPGGSMETLYFDYVNEWWDVRHHDNVLLLHYSDAKRDLKGTVSKLANFYDIDLTSDQMENVVRKCGFDHMKQNDHLFDYKLPVLHGYDGSQTVFKPKSLLRKGEIGLGETIFTSEEKETWKQWEETKFGSSDDPTSKLHWARYGGGDF